MSYSRGDSQALQDALHEATKPDEWTRCCWVYDPRPAWIEPGKAHERRSQVGIGRPAFLPERGAALEPLHEAHLFLWPADEAAKQIKVWRITALDATSYHWHEGTVGLELEADKVLHASGLRPTLQDRPDLVLQWHKGVAVLRPSSQTASKGVSA